MFHSANSASADLLAEWRWLLGAHARLCGWSAAGDLFYSDEHGQVWRLDTGAGEPDSVASSDQAFEQLLGDPERADELLLLPVVRAFEELHGPLGEGRCLGFTTMPVFGGDYTVENRFTISVTEHASFTGDLHRQIRDLPDGTAIQLRVVP